MNTPEGKPKRPRHDTIAALFFLAPVAAGPVFYLWYKIANAADPQSGDSHIGGGFVPLMTYLSMFLPGSIILGALFTLSAFVQYQSASKTDTPFEFPVFSFTAIGVLFVAAACTAAFTVSSLIGR